MRILGYIITTVVFINTPILLSYGKERLGALAIVLAVAFLLLWLKLNILPVRDGHKTGIRLKALIGARPILLSFVCASIFQVLFLPISYGHFRSAGIEQYVLIGNIIFSLCCLFLMYLNGIIRLCACSKSVSIANKLILVFTLSVPILGAVMWLPASGKVKREYKSGAERALWERTLPENDACRTRYPLLMLHGIGFRDMAIMNYWGRIPRYLKRFGAEIYYGNQEGIGTVSTSGADVAARIDEIRAETGAEKVNIIAHSKGGLDARYAISGAGKGAKVASLTTMNTPHRGVRFADTATKLRLPIYLRLAKVFNAIFRKFGDAVPDFYGSTMQFRTDEALAFNEQYPDDPQVYYQSYTSVMSRPSSDSLLAPSYYLIKRLGEENDGLVSVDSATWGNFRGVFRNEQSKRGISHADIVDMHREDYAGFNVLDTYINIVADLKERGF
jgi:triacylglycerol lipase